MITLRLSRAGTKKRPVYHLVAADRRARRDGRFVENLGYYIPGRKVLVIKQDRVEYWLSVGAQPTDTAKDLIKKARTQGNTEPQAKAPPTPAEKPAEAPKAEAADKPAEAPKAEAVEKPAEGSAETAKPEAESTEQSS